MHLLWPISQLSTLQTSKVADMKILLIFWSVALFGCVAVKSVPTTNLEQVREAEELIRFSLTGRFLESLQQRIQDRFSSLLIDNGLTAEKAEQTLNEVFTETATIEEQRLLDALVPIYRRYYTAEEIHQLLSFYQTEVARKSLKVSGQIAADGQEYIRVWHEHFEGQLLERIDKWLAKEGISFDK